MTGIVLSIKDVGDYDRRVVLITKEKGKIAAFARGARKTNSPFLAACQPFAYGKFSIYPGKNAYSINQVEIEEYFQDIKTDLDTLFLATYFCELTEYFTMENVDGLEMMKLLYVSLKALQKESLNNELVRRVFEVKAFSIGGYMPETRICIQCGKNEQISFFHAGGGGCVCADCQKNMTACIPMEETTRYTLQYIIYQPPEKVFNFKVSNNVQKELSEITESYRKIHIDGSFKSLDFLTF